MSPSQAPIQESFTNTPNLLTLFRILLTPIFFTVSVTAGARGVPGWPALVLGFGLQPLAGRRARESAGDPAPAAPSAPNSSRKARSERQPAHA